MAAPRSPIDPLFVHTTQELLEISFFVYVSLLSFVSCAAVPYYISSSSTVFPPFQHHAFHFHFHPITTTTMGSDIKQASFSPEYHESSQFDHTERHPGPSRALEAGRMGLSIVALASAIGILATSAHNLKIYNDTHVSNEFLLPLWPFEFNLGPSIALVACGSIMIVAATGSLLAGKIPSVCPLPHPPPYQTTY
jgi:hypothetical protein